MTSALDELIECGKTNKQLIHELFGKIKPDTDILTLAQGIDSKVDSMIGYSRLLPTTIDLNYLVCNCAPAAPYPIKDTDLVSFSVSLSKKIPGMKGKFAHTKMAFTKPVNPLYERLCKGTAEAANAGAKACGIDVPLTEIRLDVMEILDSYDIKTITNACGNELYQAYKVVPNSRVIPEYIRSRCDLVNARMEENEVYFIDVYGTDTAYDVEAKPFDYSSIYYRLENKKSPRRKAVADALNLIDKLYKDNMFSIHEFKTAFDDKMKKSNGKEKQKLTLNGSIIKDLYEGQYISTLPCLMVPSEDQSVMNVVARYGHSIHIGAEKTTFLC